MKNQMHKMESDYKVKDISLSALGRQIGFYDFVPSGPIYFV